MGPRELCHQPLQDRWHSRSRHHQPHNRAKERPLKPLQILHLPQVLQSLEIVAHYHEQISGLAPWPEERLGVRAAVDDGMQSTCVGSYFSPLEVRIGLLAASLG